MAIKKGTGKKETKKSAAKKVEVPAWLTESNSAPLINTQTENKDEGLDPQEEKVLDWILKGVVGFVLVWLGVSVLMVIGGFFHLWG